MIEVGRQASGVRRTRNSVFILISASCLLSSVFPSPLLAKLSRPVTRADVVELEEPLRLAFPGTPGPIPYEKHGRFEGVGTKDYRYVITDKQGLASAAGEGIFPNNEVNRDPRYQDLLRQGRLAGNHWKFVDGRNAEINFYKWASTSEDPGVKQFFTAVMLERAGHIEEAVKAFYAIAVHFPKTVSYTYYNTPWYVGPAALDRVTHLLRRHPDIKMELIGGKIIVQNRFDVDTKNDVFLIDPGRLVAVKKRGSPKPINLSKLKIIKTVGGPRVKLVQYENRHWQLFVEDKPFPMKAITYSVTPVGLSPDRGTWNVSRDWQLVDTNKNGRHDGFDEAFVDKNGNSRQDSNEPTIGDGKILKDLGVNTLRAYHHLYNKDLFRRLHKDFGIYVLCGDLLGGYAVGSGAAWADGTDYANPQQQEAMLASVRSMVEEHKDEPYILMWVLGNENVYGVANNAGKIPDAFFEMVNRAAALIRELDPTRPIAIANGDVLHLDIFKEKCPAVDVVGANVYRGEQGFGRHLFMEIQDLLDRPFFVSEYGCSAFGEGYTKEEAEAYQALYMANNWEDLHANMAGRGIGNALGGVLFEFMDEWWKANADLPLSVQKQRAEWYAPKSAIYKNLQPENHDNVPQFGFPFIDGWSYEEWYGLISQGTGETSPFCRFLRPAFYMMRDLFKKN